MQGSSERADACSCCYLGGCASDLAGATARTVMNLGEEQQQFALGEYALAAFESGERLARARPLQPGGMLADV